MPHVCRRVYQQYIVFTSILACLWLMPLECRSATVSVTVIDNDSSQARPARLSLVSESGERHYFFENELHPSAAVRYDKQNWINLRSIERHTTVAGFPCCTELPAGRYILTVECGKCYIPATRQLEISGSNGDANVHMDVRLKRWVDPQRLGWYSGDTHLHRTLEDTRNVMLAEELNVALPLTQWVTQAGVGPHEGDKNEVLPADDRLIQVDATHVVWPRNTEYEIFTVGEHRHTLGALFVLGHRGGLQLGVPPWKPVIEHLNRQEVGEQPVLFDMDKLDWPFAMLLPSIAPHALYELANNHMWQTEFAFVDWNTPAPPCLQPPFGTQHGGERAWIDYTQGMYHTLLNCGFRLPPSAGTANGVHPVPAGFGRVYVHLPGGFEFGDWMRELRNGRSFVTTGPMLFVTAGGNDAGHVFRWDTNESVVDIPVHIDVISERPISYGELLLNGRPVELLRARNEPTEAGAYRTTIDTQVRPTRSGWFAVRVWEERPAHRVRFAHTAPWYVEIAAQPVRPSAEERRFLVERMEQEIARSRNVVSAAALAEYEQSLHEYSELPIQDDSDNVAANSRGLSDSGNSERWLENMVADHRFTADEVRLATGMSLQQATDAVKRYRMRAATDRATRNNDDAAVDAPAHGSTRILPYPGGRHPRRGFLEGAIHPQRETKVSVFAPWADGGYAVVDVPEAIFSNLGLTYLAHTHIPTVWDARQVTLPKLEWQETKDGLTCQRVLPNGIAFKCDVHAVERGAEMSISLTNGTDQPLTGLRVQVCTMLKGLVGFNLQQSLPQIVRDPVIAVRAWGTDRWLLTGWTPNHRVWTNPPVPCLHSDPVFPDCQPGQTVVVRGVLKYFAGAEIEAEIEQVQRLLRE